MKAIKKSDGEEVDVRLLHPCEYLAIEPDTEGYAIFRADDLLDDPKARVAFQNHNEEYYYKRVLDEYNKLHQATKE